MVVCHYAKSRLVAEVTGGSSCRPYLRLFVINVIEKYKKQKLVVDVVQLYVLSVMKNMYAKKVKNSGS